MKTKTQEKYEKIYGDEVSHSGLCFTGRCRLCEKEDILKALSEQEEELNRKNDNLILNIKRDFEQHYKRMAIQKNDVFEKKLQAQKQKFEELINQRIGQYSRLHKKTKGNNAFLEKWEAMVELKIELKEALNNQSPQNHTKSDNGGSHSWDSEGHDKSKRRTLATATPQSIQTDKTPSSDDLTNPTLDVVSRIDGQTEDRGSNICECGHDKIKHQNPFGLGDLESARIQGVSIDRCRSKYCRCKSFKAQAGGK